MAETTIKKISIKNQDINSKIIQANLKKLDILKELLVNSPISNASQKQ